MKEESVPSILCAQSSIVWNPLLGGLFSVTISLEAETTEKVHTLTGKGKATSKWLFQQVFSVGEI